MIGIGNVDVSVFPMAEKALLNIIRFLQKTEPFSFLDLTKDEKELHRLFDEEYIENIVAYIHAAQEIGAVAAFDEKCSRGVGVLNLIQVMAQPGNTLMVFKHGIIEFTHKLHGSKRTPEEYAETFTDHFVDIDTLLPDKASWMQLTNTTMQYASAVMPEKGLPRLVKRMHYVSFGECSVPICLRVYVLVMQRGNFLSASNGFWLPMQGEPNTAEDLHRGTSSDAPAVRLVRCKAESRGSLRMIIR